MKDWTINERVGGRQTAGGVINNSGEGGVGRSGERVDRAIKHPCPWSRHHPRESCNLRSLSVPESRVSRASPHRGRGSRGSQVLRRARGDLKFRK